MSKPQLLTESDEVYGARIMSGLVCECGLPNPPFVAPGHEPKTFGDDLFAYERGQAPRGWCPACAPWARSNSILEAVQ